MLISYGLLFQHDFETGSTYRYDELEEMARRIGSYLTRQGFKKGDVIAYLGTNNPEFALLLLGCASIGVTLTTANPAYTEGKGLFCGLGKSNGYF